MNASFRSAVLLLAAVALAAVAHAAGPTPATAAQQVADRLVVAGVRSILNFAPTVLTVPADVQVRGVDMAGELQILAFREQHSRLARSRTTKELLA